METFKFTPHLILVGVLGVFIAVCAFTTQGRVDESMPVRLALPDALGAYYGVDILHCQNERCLKSFSIENLTNSFACPECEGVLDTVSLAERQLLPADTEILHRMYKSDTGRSFYVSVVVGGSERRSIHKPQVCLVAQGNSITKQYPVSVPVSGDKPLDVMLMELNESRMVFAYWFTNGKRTTASHLSRLFWIAWNGIVHGERERWAYISITSSFRGGDDAQVSWLKDRVADLYLATVGD